MQAYGKTAYLITTLKTVPRGTEGAVSLEGTAAGITAAALFGVLALGLKLVGQNVLSTASVHFVHTLHVGGHCVLADFQDLYEQQQKRRGPCAHDDFHCPLRCNTPCP